MKSFKTSFYFNEEVNEIFSLYNIQNFKIILGINNSSKCYFKCNTKYIYSFKLLFQVHKVLKVIIFTNKILIFYFNKFKSEILSLAYSYF